MEFGLFVILVVAGSVGLLRKSILFAGISVSIFFILAVLLSTGQDITMVENTNSTTVTKASNGSVIEKGSLNGSKEVVVLSSDQNMISYVFYGAGIFATTLLVRQLMNLGNGSVI